MPPRTPKALPRLAGGAWKPLTFRTSVGVRERAERIVDKVHVGRGLPKWQVYEMIFVIGLERVETIYETEGAGGVARACVDRGGE